MAYATITHVVMHHSARPTYTATSVPNVTAVGVFIDEAAAALDFALVRAGYDAPLLSSAPSSVKAYFQQANAYGALCMVERSAQVGHNENDFCAMFKEALKMIANGQLPGLDKNAEESQPRYSLATPPFFSRDMET
jgi:hypothetical protein